MKSSQFFIKVLFICAVLAFSCKENEPRGDEFSWSPRDNQVVINSLESKELLCLEIAGDSLGGITVIDTLNSGDDHFHKPSHSGDGEYVLYSKSTPKNYGIFVWSISKKTARKLVELKVTNSKELNESVNPFWSSALNRVIWVDWLAERKSLNSIDVAGKRNQILYQARCERLVASAVPGRNLVSFIVQNHEKESMNGLWLIQTDGTNLQQIVMGDEIQAHNWSPDGRKIAIFKKIEVKDKDKTNTKFELSIADSAGKSEKVLFQPQHEILALDWAPDGKQLALLAGTDSLKNVWSINLESGAPVKLTFENVDRYFGWGMSGEIYYTIKTKVNLPALSKLEAEVKDISTSLYGNEHQNTLIKSQNFKSTFSEENILSFSSHQKQPYTAYYKIFQTGLFGSTFFCPVVKLASGVWMIARNQETHLVVADEMYLAGKYQLALNHLNQAFAMDFQADSTAKQFTIDPILKIEPDSIRNKILQEKFQETPLIRLVLILRKIGKIELADAYFQAYKKYLNYQIEAKNASANKREEAVWQLLSTYGRYRALAEGIKDMDELLQINPKDSSYAAGIYVNQAILALEDNESDLGIEKLKQAISILPNSESNSNDFRIIFALVEARVELTRPEKLITLCELAIQRHPDDEKISELYEFLGDLYQRIEKSDEAYTAYQHAVASNPDGYEVWEKLFALAQMN